MEADTTAQVAEIFTEAGNAFNRLGELCLMLHGRGEAQMQTQASAKWTQKEIEMLREAVSRFGSDLEAISQAVKTKSITQIKRQMRNQSFEQAGLSTDSNLRADTEVPAQMYADKEDYANQEEVTADQDYDSDGES